MSQKNIEYLAKALCQLDGYNPEATGSFGIKVIREGRLTDTGHDTRRGHVETFTAPPMWQMYIHKAKKINDILGLNQNADTQKPTA